MAEIIIRKAVIADLDGIMSIFESARIFMRLSGNPNQWINGYPERNLITNEIILGHCYVCITSGGSIVGTFCVLPGPEPTYNKIYKGKWLNDKPYYVIHRLASDGKVKGIGKICLEWCINKYKNIRIDTHIDNKIMQNLAEYYGFIRCGIIYVQNGTSRIAYQRESLE